MKKTILLFAALPTIGLLAAFSLRNPVSEKKAPRTDDPFQTFLAQFKPTTLPYTISPKQLQERMTNAMNTQDIKSLKRSKGSSRLNDPEGFLPFNRMEMMSRVPTFHEPEAQMATADHHLVIYTVSRGFSRPYKSYVAVVFDKQGTALATHTIAETSYDYLSAVSVDHNLQAAVQTYRINWKDTDEDNTDRERAIAGLTPETAKVLDLTQPDENDMDRKLRPAKKHELPAGASIGSVERH
ncbi:MAG: hypothetical protein ABMA02_16805 [Saprospiraceae bacterium]